MFKGLLRIKGELDLAQFWPEHGSDVDTMIIKIVPDSFEFSPDPAHVPFKKTKIFTGAVVKGAETKPAISKGKITVRAQHIDGMEIHIQALLRGKGLKENGKKFRQYLGETSTTRLHDFLARLQRTSIPCEVITRVDHPNDVFDTYGRLIGDVLVTVDGKQVDLNYWLVENGWALPAFYNSAAKEEITAVRRLAENARKGKKGVWKFLSRNVSPFELKLVFRPHGQPNPEKDAGPAIVPKLFRRQVRFHVSDLNHLFSGSFRGFLARQKDGWVKTSDFLKNPKIKPSSRTADLGLLVDKRGNFKASPADIVFFEKPSTLLDNKGRKITSWAA